jgi:hypothetical protein
MFYEQEAIKKLVECPYCKNAYRDPRALQCGRSLCFDCIELLMNKEANGLDCPVCSAFHHAPENGFFKILTLGDISSTQPNDVSRGAIAEDVKTKMKTIKEKTEKLNFFITHPIDNIKEHCSDLKLKVQLETELKIEKIMKFNEEFIRQIEKYEIECIDKCKIDKSLFEETINELDEIYSKWTSYMSNSKIDEEELKKVLDEAKQLLQKADTKKIEICAELFNKKLMVFNENRNELSSSLVGSIEYDFIKLFSKAYFKDLKEIDLKNKMSNPNMALFQMKALANNMFLFAYSHSNNKSINLDLFDKDGNLIKRVNHLNLSNHSFNLINKIILAIKENNIFLFIGYNEFNLRNPGSQSKHFLRKFDQNFNFIKEINIGFPINTLSTYKENVYIHFNSSIMVYDSNLININTIGQSNPALPFYLPNTITQFEVNDAYFLYLNGSFINVMDKKDGKIIKTLNTVAKSFFSSDVNRNIIFFNEVDKTIVFYDLNGFKTEYVLDSIPEGFKPIETLNEDLVYFNSKSSKILRL